MADIVDINNALVNLIAGIVYPNGTANPSVTGQPILVYQGWPSADALANDFTANKVHISVFSSGSSKIININNGEWWTVSTTNGLATIARETRRQTKQFQVTIWANCFDARDPLAKIVDSALSTISRLAIADGSVAKIAFTNDLQLDDKQKFGVYRRDLFYEVEYSTIETTTATPITQVNINLARKYSDPVIPKVPVSTVGVNVTVTN